MGQLQMGATINVTPQAAIEKAITFFGKGGVGLTLIRQSEEEAYFTSAGGHVHVTATPANGDERTDVTVQTREWEYDVKKFMATL